MFIYEKKVGGKTQLYGNISDNKPSATDSHLTYETADGTEILDLSVNDSFVDDHKGGMVRKATGDSVICFIGAQQVIPAE